MLEVPFIEEEVFATLSSCVNKALDGVLAQELGLCKNRGDEFLQGVLW